MNLLNLNFNFSIIWKALRKNIATLLMISIISGCLSFIVADWGIEKKYTSTLNLAVIAEDNLTNTLSSRKLTAAVNRYVNVFEKDVMNKKICEGLGVDKIQGSINISSIYGSNLIVVECIANSPGTSFKMVQLFRENYQSVASQINGTYKVTDLGTSSVDLISTSDSFSFIIALLIAIITLVLGIGVVIFSKIFDGKIKDEKQAKNEIDAYFLGTIGHEKKRNNMLITHPDVSSSYVESVKKITAKILYIAERKKYKTILVTSSLEAEGKSTTSANIALAMANQGKKVLLIDADLRRRVQFKRFEKEDSPDLSEYLDGKIDMEQIVKKDKENNIYYLFTKNARDDADELLENGHMQKLLENMKNKMDYIIIDTAPAGITRDAQVLSTYVDAAVIVVRQEKAKITMINDIIDDLEQEKMGIMGFVLNDMSLKKTYSSNTYNDYYTKNREFTDS